MGKKSLTQLQFRIDLYCKLLGYSEKAKLQSLRVDLGAKRVFKPENERLRPLGEAPKTRHSRVMRV
jgi:hypothetical protein